MMKLIIYRERKQVMKSVDLTATSNLLVVFILNKIYHLNIW